MWAEVCTHRVLRPRDEAGAWVRQRGMPTPPRRVEKQTTNGKRYGVTYRKPERSRGFVGRVSCQEAYSVRPEVASSGHVAERP